MAITPSEKKFRMLSPIATPLPHPPYACMWPTLPHIFLYISTLNEQTFTSITNCFEKWQIAASLLCSEAYSPIVLPPVTLLTVSLAILAGLKQTETYWGLNTCTMPYQQFTPTCCRWLRDKKFYGVKILSLQILIFACRDTLRNKWEFAPFKNVPLYSSSWLTNLADTVASHGISRASNT